MQSFRTVSVAGQLYQRNAAKCEEVAERHPAGHRIIWYRHGRVVCPQRGFDQPLHGTGQSNKLDAHARILSQDTRPGKKQKYHILVDDITVITNWPKLLEILWVHCDGCTTSWPVHRRIRKLLVDAIKQDEITIASMQNTNGGITSCWHGLLGDGFQVREKIANENDKKDAQKGQRA